MNLTLLQGDCREVLTTMADNSVNCCVTSPPYFGLRDYGVDGQIGLEQTPAEYVEQMVSVFREVRRTLRDDGTLWLNIGDSYANDGKWGGHTGGKHVKALHASPIGRNKKYTGLKPKDLIGIPWRLAFALQADGWFLRQDIIWHKPNPMPESVIDRCTKAHEYVFLLSKSERYFYDHKAIAEPSTGRDPGNQSHKYAEAYQGGASEHRTKAGLMAYSFKRKTMTTPPPGTPPQHRENRDNVIYNGETRNRRSVWTVATRPYRGAHFATFPPDLIKPCVLAGCPIDGVVLDPFAGSGTTGKVALELGRRAVLIEINPDYIELIHERCCVTYGLPLVVE